MISKTSLPPSDMKTWIPADWPAPGNIHAGTTTRLGGDSRPPFDGFNLAEHVGDDPGSVARNRLQLQGQLNLPAEPDWLKQRHGGRVVEVTSDEPAEADGAYTGEAGEVCAVLTADCIPLLLCNRTGTEIAALHIGWRGLCQGIIKNALVMFNANPRELLAWLGPYISQRNYEVGADVISACSGEKGTDLFFGGKGDRFEICPQPAPGKNKSVPFSQAIRQSRANHWYLDLGQLVKTELLQQGVVNVYGCNQCTYTGKDLFYSYRRDGVTGRMASIIWMDTEKTKLEKLARTAVIHGVGSPTENNWDVM